MLKPIQICHSRKIYSKKKISQLKRITIVKIINPKYIKLAIKRKTLSKLCQLHHKLTLLRLEPKEKIKRLLILIIARRE
jgi:hypothetical protein